MILKAVYMEMYVSVPFLSAESIVIVMCTAMKLDGIIGFFISFPL